MCIYLAQVAVGFLLRQAAPMRVVHGTAAGLEGCDGGGPASLRTRVADNLVELVLALPGAALRVRVHLEGCER